MKASDKQKEANSSKNKSEDLHIDFKGKFSFIFKTLKVIYILSFTETPYIRDLEGKINQINKLFHNYEEQTLYNSLSDLVLIKLNGPLKIQSPTNKYAAAVLVLFAKYLQNKIRFQKFFEDLLVLIREVISFVKRNGSKSNSIKIINEFGDYLNDYSQKLDSVKKASSLKNNEEEEKILSANDYDNMIKKLNNDLKVLKDELRKKEKDLEISNSKIIQANLDTGTYKDINIFLENKLKEMERKFDAKFKSNENEISNLKNEISNLKNENANLKNALTAQNNEITNLKESRTSQNNEIANLKKVIVAQNETIALQENTIQMLKEQNNTLFEIENQDREWIRTLRDSFYQLDADYNDIIENVNGLNISLQQIINNLENYNPFNINFFE